MENLWVAGCGSRVLSKPLLSLHLPARDTNKTGVIFAKARARARPLSGGAPAPPQPPVGGWGLGRGGGASANDAVRCLKDAERL